MLFVRLKTEHVLSEDESARGMRRGSLTLPLLKEWLPEPPSHQVFVTVCGPRPFTDTAQRYKSSYDIFKRINVDDGERRNIVDDTYSRDTWLCSTKKQ